MPKALTENWYNSC